jgi:hypothetical protein
MDGCLGIAMCLKGFADLWQVRSHTRQAVRVLGFVEAWLRANQLNLVLSDRITYERSVAAARAGLSTSDFTAAWEEGSRLTLEHAIGVALKEE